MSHDAHHSRSRQIDFPEVDYRTWRTRVEAELQSQDFDEALVSRLLGGLEVQPLYTRQSSAALEFLKASEATRHGWLICQSYRMPDLSESAESVHQDLTNGVQGFLLRFDKGLQKSSTATGTDTLEVGAAAQQQDHFNQIFPESSPLPEVLLLDAGVSGLAIGGDIASWMESRQIPPADLRLALGIDPLDQLAADGVLPISPPQAAAQMKQAIELCEHRLPGSRAVGVSTEIYLNGGADASLQLAVALSTAVEYIRWLESTGVNPRDTVDQFVFRFGTGKDLFGEICKLRAFRYLWHKVARHCGTELRQPAWIHAETADRILTARDVATNILRSSSGTFAAILGGANTISCPAYDSVRGNSSDRGRRLARNIQHILREESHLDLAIDPSRGSYYIESLTKEMAYKAWEHFRQFEREGGMLASLSTGAIQGTLTRLWETRRQCFSDRESPITGISFFADPDQAPPRPPSSTIAGVFPEQTEILPTSGSIPVRIEPIEAHRDSADYEALRDIADRLAETSGHRPTIFVLPVPDLPRARESISFAGDFFRAGGFRVVVQDQKTDTSDPNSERFPGENYQEKGSQIVCICAAREIIGQTESRLASEARAAGATTVIRVTPELRSSDQPCPPGVDISIHPGVDAVAVLAGLLDAITGTPGGGE